jgi:hypothetical protein
LVSISFVPDGTVLGTNGGSYVTSNLFATFNAKFGSPAAWEGLILQAAQAWAQQTNINFTVVPDNGAAIGSGSYQQGDPGMGDIRIGGYAFGNSALGMAFMPPPVNNYSIAGDVDFNTAQVFNNGSTYDLFSVAAHEIGHALGLGHSTSTQAVMYTYYNGVKKGLSSDDVNGIRAVYSAGKPRSPDAYDAVTPNNSFASAADITAQISSSSQTAVISSLDITTPAEQDYFTFTAPTGSSSTLTATAQSAGLSLLQPQLNVFDANRKLLGSVSGTRNGDTVSFTVRNVTPGSRYYVEVTSPLTTSFGTGAYALTLNLGTGPAPVVPLPNTQLLNGSPIHGGGGIPDLTRTPGHGPYDSSRDFLDTAPSFHADAAPPGGLPLSWNVSAAPEPDPSVWTSALPGGLVRMLAHASPERGSDAGPASAASLTDPAWVVGSGSAGPDGWLSLS